MLLSSADFLEQMKKSFYKPPALKPMGR